MKPCGRPAAVPRYMLPWAAGAPRAESIARRSNALASPSWRGRVGETSSVARCEPGWGELLCTGEVHPTPTTFATLGSRPSPSRGSLRNSALICWDSYWPRSLAACSVWRRCLSADVASAELQGALHVVRESEEIEVALVA